MNFSQKRKIAKAYNEMGGRIYDIRYSEEQEKKYNKLLDRIKPNFNEIVLDLGCGTGLLMQHLSSFSVGIDISSGLLSKASDRHREIRSSNIVLGDIEKLPFRESIFHTSFMVTTLQNTPSPMHAFDELRRVSREGAMIGISVLKRGFTKENFESLISRSFIDKPIIIDEDDSKDWFFITKLPS